MSKPLKYCLVEIDGLTGQSNKQKNRSVTKKYRKAKPFRRKYINVGIQNLREEEKLIWKHVEKRKHILRVRKCAKNYEIMIPFKSKNTKIVTKSSHFNPLIESKHLCQICYEKFGINDITFIDCKVKGTRDKSRKKIICDRYKAICQKCRKRCSHSCPFCRSHKLNPIKIRFRKKKLPYAERLKIREQKAIAKQQAAKRQAERYRYQSRLIRCRYCNHINSQYQVTQIQSRVADAPLISRFTCSNCRTQQSI